MHELESLESYSLDDASVDHLAEIFRALADPSRLRILTLLLESEQNVSALAASVGISEAGVSHHLRNLRQLRIVRGRRQGRQVYYSLDDEHVSDLIRHGIEHVHHG